MKLSKITLALSNLLFVVSLLASPKTFASHQKESLFIAVSRMKLN